MTVVNTQRDLKERVGELLGAEWSESDLDECITSLKASGFELGNDLAVYELHFLHPTGMKWERNGDNL